MNTATRQKSAFDGKRAWRGVAPKMIMSLVASFILLVTAPGPNQATANVFTKALREAGEAGGKAGRHIADMPGGAARFVSKLPQKPGQLALAAHATPDGHWKFANSAGDVFTAASPEEMARVARTLSPEGASLNAKLALYLTEESLFEHAEFLKLLPKGSSHFIVTGKQSFPIEVVRTAGSVERIARVAANVVVPLTNRKAFDEVIWQLSRPLRKAEIRVLSLNPGARAALPPAPRFDKTTRQAMVDVVDPDALAEALPSVRGQTVMISGEIRGNALHFIPESGTARSINLAHVREAARNSDVNLIVLQSRSPLQPGGRNWLWQTVEVGGLKDALNRATFSDFLNALGAGGSQKFRVTATAQEAGRTIIEATPLPAEVVVPYSDVVGGWLGEVTSSVTGNVVTTALTADMRDKERQEELDNRIIPGIPSIYQMFYFVSIVFGVVAWTVSREVWAMIWPPEDRAEYRSSIGYNAARTVKTLVFLFVFLPIAGIPLLLLSLLLQIWTVLGWIWAGLTSPFRVWRWLRNRGA